MLNMLNVLKKEQLSAPPSGSWPPSVHGKKIQRDSNGHYESTLLRSRSEPMTWCDSLTPLSNTEFPNTRCSSHTWHIWASYPLVFHSPLMEIARSALVGHIAYLSLVCLALCRSDGPALFLHFKYPSFWLRPIWSPSPVHSPPASSSRGSFHQVIGLGLYIVSVFRWFCTT